MYTSITMIVFILHKKIRQLGERSLYKTALLLATLFLLSSTVSAQINFGSFDASYPLTLSSPSENLTFPDPIHVESGLNQIELAEAIILQIEGLKQLDVGVYITADVWLLKDGNEDNSTVPERRIAFTLRAAYSNVGTDKGHTKTGSPEIDISSNIGSIRFPLLERQFNAPGPPPRPPGTFTPADHLDIAELYFYGDIDVGNVEGGEYKGTITVTVEYDNPPSEHPPEE